MYITALGLGIGGLTMAVSGYPILGFISVVVACFLVDFSTYR